MNINILAGMDPPEPGLDDLLTAVREYKEPIEEKPVVDNRKEVNGFDYTEPTLHSIANGELSKSALKILHERFLKERIHQTSFLRTTPFIFKPDEKTVLTVEKIKQAREYFDFL